MIRRYHKKNQLLLLAEWKPDTDNQKLTCGVPPMGGHQGKYNI